MATTNPRKPKEDADPPKRSATAIARDPLNLNWRLYQQLGKLLDDIEAGDRDETMTFPQRIAAMIAIARVQKVFIDLRKGEFSGTAGSAVEKYAAAFAAGHGSSGRDQNPGRPSTAIQFGLGSDAEPGDPDYGLDA